VERETQRAALMEWSHSVLFALLGSQERRDVRKLSASPFGLWLRHRAGLLFPDSPVVEDIESLVAAIDETHLPAVTDHVPRSFEAVATLEERIEELRFLLNDLFQIVTSADAGRDPLTRALNRRFLPSVLGREMALAGKHETPLCLALVDIDHFKRVNDGHGHAAGDAALRHVADYLLANVRSSDFVFRYGGEEFLIVFCETDLRAAQSIAERICRNLAQESIQLPDGSTLALTASIGVARLKGTPITNSCFRRPIRRCIRPKTAGATAW
jgi:diguanylate cyclase